jgi:hypothetical protein
MFGIMHFGPDIIKKKACPIQRFQANLDFKGRNLPIFKRTLVVIKESLGGNSKTTLICTCSRKQVHEDETVNTLKFAQRAKKIKNRVCSNLKVNFGSF